MTEYKPDGRIKLEKNDSWRVWNRTDSHGELYFKRATGALDEMESSKALCNVLSEYYSPNMKVLDVGCGAGHYLTSFRKRLDKNIDYTGVDATKSHIEFAKQAYGDSAAFFQDDILGLQFKDNSFDLVVCNNVILHLPPPPIKPISELIRVAKKYIIIRMLTAGRTYITRVLSTPGETEGIPDSEKDMIKENGDIPAFTFFNMYSESYLKGIIDDMGTISDIKIERDNSWESFNNEQYAGKDATNVVDGKQISGNMLLNWSFVKLTKKN